MVSTLVDAIAARQPRGTPIEIWFQDEARIGRKNKITRRWARRGTRPFAPHDQKRTSSAYIFGAVCPVEGKGAGLVLPSCNTEAMAIHLEEISAAVARAGRPRGPCPGSGRLARLREAPGPEQHHALATAAEIPRAEPSARREHLAAHARQLAVQPRPQILRRCPRPLLLRLEQAHRHALDNHVYRHPRMGLSVIINETWYYGSRRRSRAFALGDRATRR